MIIGNPDVVAIESGVARAYAERGALALGFFIVHIGGRSFGVRSAEATLLACSFDGVMARMAHRGAHVAPFATEPCGLVADAFRYALYAPEEGLKGAFGLSRRELGDLFYTNKLMWAPDGDAAFDDGSYILQFDVGDCVRLIAFRCLESGAHDPASIEDVWLNANDFYCLLQRWHSTFTAEWECAPKAPA